ncbi:MAG: hypothetical protein A4S14_14620 [Proteobacteria bacterium SG_bin9]|nr:MAG: hypothetical protein A4S14_14620 [Proteobacteria bacterium SG_bin9]
MDQPNPPTSTARPLAASPPSVNLIRGAAELADFIFGSREPRFQRKVYNLVQQNKLPHFRLGVSICARKSKLLQWIAEQESSCER